MLENAFAADCTFQPPKMTTIDDLRKSYSLEKSVLQGAKIVRIDGHEVYSVSRVAFPVAQPNEFFCVSFAQKTD